MPPTLPKRAQSPMQLTLPTVGKDSAVKQDKTPNAAEMKYREISERTLTRDGCWLERAVMSMATRPHRKKDARTMKAMKVRFLPSLHSMHKDTENDSILPI